MLAGWETAATFHFRNDCKSAISEGPPYEGFSATCWISQEQNPDLLSLCYYPGLAYVLYDNDVESRVENTYN